MVPSLVGTSRSSAEIAIEYQLIGEEDRGIAISLGEGGDIPATPKNFSISLKFKRRKMGSFLRVKFVFFPPDSRDMSGPK